MNEYKFKVNFKTGRIISTEDTTLEETIVCNDYNSIKFNFTFDKEFDKYLFKMINPKCEIALVQEIKDNEILIGKNVFTQNGEYQFEVSGYGEDSRLTNNAIKEFYVRSELVKSDDVEVPEEKVSVLDDLINDVTTLENNVEAKEKERDTAETSRISSENERVKQESAREENEEKRKENEVSRNDAETTRNSNEETRKTNEETRIKNEQTRVSNEGIRVSSESTRVSNETTRVTQEKAREDYITDLKKRVDDGEFNGECNFATFEIDIDTGELVMNKTEDLLLDFQIENGRLEVIING